MTDNNEPADVFKVALLVSIACVLQIAESVIPHPLPGLRLGLANVITLIALVKMGPGSAMEITILRTVLASLIMGTFLSPVFLLSFVAGIASTAVMGLCFWLMGFTKQRGFSIVGVSIVGALAHNIVQLFLAYVIMIRHPGIFTLLPWLSIGAVMMGWFTGLIAGKVCSNLQASQWQTLQSIDWAGAGVIPSGADREPGLGAQRVLSGSFVAGESFIHRLPPELKIMSIFILSLGILILNNPWFYLGSLFFLCLAVVQSQTPFRFITKTVGRCFFMLAVSFFFPVFYNSGTHVMGQIAGLKITAEGMSAGTGLAGRILSLVLFSAMLLRTTSPKALVQGMSRMLAPLKIVGIATDRMATIFFLSWSAIPIFWEISKEIIRALGIRGIRDLSRLIPLASDFITRFYLEAEVAFALVNTKPGIVRGR